MLIRQTLLYLPAQLLAPVAQFLSLVAWTHWADQTTIGTITLITTTQDFLMMTLLGFWTQYAIRFLGGGDQDDSSAATTSAVLAGSCLLQALLAVAMLRLDIAPDAAWTLDAAVALFVVTRALNMFLGERGRSRGDILQYTVQTLAGPLVGVVLGLVLLIRFGSDPTLVIAAYGLTQGMAALYGMVRDRGWMGWGRPDLRLVGAAVTYGGPLFAAGLFGWASINAGRFVIDFMRGVAAAGTYSIGFGLGYRASTVAAMGVTAAAFPLAVRLIESGQRQAAFRQLAQNGVLLTAALSSSLVGLALVSEDLVRLTIAASLYQPTLSIMRWTLLAGGLISFRIHFLHQSFLLDGKTMPLLWLNGLDALLTIGLSVVLIQIDPFVGAAMALTATAVIMTLVTGIWSARIGLLLPWDDVARIAGANAAMVVAVELLPKGEGWLTLAGKIAVGGAAFVVAGGLLYAPRMRGYFQPARSSQA